MFAAFVIALFSPRTCQLVYIVVVALLHYAVCMPSACTLSSAISLERFSFVYIRSSVSLLFLFGSWFQVRWICEGTLTIFGIKWNFEERWDGGREIVYTKRALISCQHTHTHTGDVLYIEYVRYILSVELCHLNLDDETKKWKSIELNFWNDWKSEWNRIVELLNGNL